MVQELALRFINILPLRLQNTARQFMKFAVVGVIGAVVDFGSYNILTRGIGWTDTYEIFGYQIIAANLVSVFLAITSNFILNRYWTFHATGGNAATQGAGYFALNGFTFILNQIVTSFFTFHVPLIALIFGSQKDNIAKALAIGIILFLNFFGSKFLIFGKKK
ncbi:MAG: GtrA family protein [Candidatus Andersenbacteria bacterium]